MCGAAWVTEVDALGMLTRTWDPDSEASVLLAAHREVFASQADEDWLAWKYGRGDGVGMGLWAGAELAAFCGGLPRTLWWNGRPRRGLQIVDVMVRSAWRGGGRRQGAFYRVSQALYEAQLGAGRAFDAGFGFPSHRHLALAQRLNVLHDAGPVWAAVWGDASRAVMSQIRLQAPNWVVDELPHQACAPAVERAWALMRGGLADVVLPERRASVLQWRREGWSGRPVRYLGLRRHWHRAHSGVVVVDAGGPTGRPAWWLDWVGPPELLRLGWACALEAALHQGASNLQGWFSERPWQALTGTQPVALEEVARIGVPVASAVSSEELTRCRWWLMAGDTDFL